MVKIKELKFSLNTGSNASIIHTTSDINGILECVMLDIQKSCNVKIWIEDYNDVILYEGKNVIGQKYLPLAQEQISPDNQKLNFGTSKWSLNNKLVISVEGGLNTIVHFMIKYS